MNINEGDMGGQEKKLSEHDDSRLKGYEGDLRCQNANVLKRMRQGQMALVIVRNKNLRNLIARDCISLKILNIKLPWKISP